MQEDQVRTNILLVDDRDENLVALQSLLEDLGENLLVARSGTEALRQLLSRDFAMILLDVQMPGMSGFETAALIRSRGKWQSTPIIFLTADNSDESKSFEGYRLGAVDFMHKPIVAEVLRAKVKVFVELAKKTELVRLHVERLQQEMAVRKELEAKLLEIARSDALTGLLVRRAGQEALEREVAHAVRYGAPLGFVLFDVDHFKRVNDTHGHGAGDTVLRAIGKTVAEAVRKCDVAVRWGGEELLLALPHTTDAGARMLAERLRIAIGQLTFDNGLSVTISAGVAELDKDGSAEAAISRADGKLYEAKGAGRNRVL
jgi:diguanylate cyclase